MLSSKSISEKINYISISTTCDKTVYLPRIYNLLKHIETCKTIKKIASNITN